MIVVRFKVTCRPGHTEHVLAVMADVIAPSRVLPGVLHFDIGRDLAAPDSVIATEVFTDRAALDRQEALPEVAKVMDLLPHALAAPPEATIYHVSSAEAYA